VPFRGFRLAHDELVMMDTDQGLIFRVKEF